jgi:hypothetical protein
MHVRDFYDLHNKRSCWVDHYMQDFVVVVAGCFLEAILNVFPKLLGVSFMAVTKPGLAMVCDVKACCIYRPSFELTRCIAFAQPGNISAKLMLARFARCE